MSQRRKEKEEIKALTTEQRITRLEVVVDQIGNKNLDFLIHNVRVLQSSLELHEQKIREVNEFFRTKSGLPEEYLAWLDAREKAAMERTAQPAPAMGICAPSETNPQVTVCGKSSKESRLAKHGDAITCQNCIASLDFGQQSKNEKGPGTPTSPSDNTPTQIKEAGGVIVRKGNKPEETPKDENTKGN